MPVLYSSGKYRFRNISPKQLSGQVTKEDKMSIKDLKWLAKNYCINNKKYWQPQIYDFMEEVIRTFEALENVIAQKENAFDVNNIKEVRNING